MCTVSFYKSKNGVIITSNRDEKLARKSALPPAEYRVNGYELVFPKDQEKGGTWFAFNKDLNQVIILLNGGFEKHNSKSNYRKSRGLIVLDLISNQNTKFSFEDMNLNGVEPFTCVFFAEEILVELVWDGKKKHSKIIEENSCIWSSSTLYSPEIRKDRKVWFSEFLKQNENLDEHNFIDFHTNTSKENKTNGLVIDRKGLLKTLSVTQIMFSSKFVKLSHLDLIKNENEELIYSLETS